MLFPQDSHHAFLPMLDVRALLALEPRGFLMLDVPFISLESVSTGPVGMTRVMA